MSLKALHEQLQIAQTRLDRYRAALDLASVEIEQRNRRIIDLTAFTRRAGQVSRAGELLRLALIQAVETTAAPVGAIVLIDPATKELSLGAHKGLTADLRQVLTGRELRHGAAALMPHLVSGAGALLERDTPLDESEQMLLTAAELSSLVSLPLRFGPKILGAVVIGLDEPRSFKPTDLYFLMAVSQETTLALENLSLREGMWHTAESFLTGGITTEELQETDLNIETAAPGNELPAAPSNDLEALLAGMREAENEVQQQNIDLQALNNLIEQMNRNLNLAEILQHTVDETITLLKTDAAWIYLLDKKDRLRMQASIGLSAAYVQAMKILEMGQGLEGQVISQPKPHFLTDIQGHPYLVKEGFQAVAVSPLPRPGEETLPNLGVVVTARQAARSWQPREMRLLSSIANQVALTIENARLYAQIQQDEAQLRTDNETLRTANDILLEKTAYLEGFVGEELLPFLGQAGHTIHHLLAEETELAPEQIETANAIRQVVDHLIDQIQTIEHINIDLETAFDSQYAPKPLRLGGTAPPADESEPEPPPSGQAMSFEEAIAAGLVPDHILQREEEEE